MAESSLSHPRNWLSRLASVCWERKRLCLLVLFASISTIVPVAVGPLLTREAVNDAMAGNLSRIGWLAGVLGIIAVIDFVGNFVRRNYAGELSQWVQHSLRSQVFDSIQKLDGRGQDALGAGQVISRTNSDLQQLNVMLNMCPVPLAVITYYVVGLGIMLWMSPSLTLVVIAVIGGLAITGIRARKRVFEQTGQASDQLAQMTEHTREVLDKISIVKSCVAEKREFDRLEQAARGLAGSRIKAAITQAFPGVTMQALPALGQVALLCCGGWAVIHGSIDLGTFIAFAGFLAMLTGPTRVLASYLIISQRTRASVERLFSLIDAKPTLRDGNQPLKGTLQGLCFNDVSFAYNDGQAVLKQLSFAIHAGETVAVVGASGSGKSTLSLLIPRFYDPTSGGINLVTSEGDQALPELTLESLRQAVGVVFEDAFLFAGSIAQNIAYHRPQASREEIRDAARAAGALAFIEAFPQGLDHRISAGGEGLSGGQRQRIALARALFSRPSLLVVDDATSAVDATTEADINQALKRYADAEHMLLVIARRSSTLRLADKILVLDQGAMVDFGSQEELEQRCPVFAELTSGSGEFLGADTAPGYPLWPADTGERSAADAGAAGHSAVAAKEAASPAVEGSQTADSAPATHSVTAAQAKDASVNQSSAGTFLHRMATIPAASRQQASNNQPSRFLAFIKPVRVPFILAGILIIIDTLASLGIPLLLKRGLDQGVSAANIGTLLITGGLALILVIIGWCAFSGQNMFASRAAEAVQYAIRLKSFRQLLKLDMRYHESQSSARLNRMTVDVDALARFLQSGLVQAITSLVTLFGIAVAMLWLDPVLCLVAFATLPAVALATLIYRNLSAKAYSRARTHIGKVNNALQERVAGMRVVQSHGQQHKETARIKALSDSFRAVRVKAQKYLAVYFPFITLCTEIAYACVVFAGAERVGEHLMTAGTLAAFLLFLGMFYGPLQQLSGIMDSYQQAMASKQHIDELLEMPTIEDIDLEPSTVQQSNDNSVELVDVHYRYDESQQKALNGLNLSLPAGKVVAVVGESGAGKSTLIKLLAGLYQADSGSITLGGTAISTIPLQHYRQQVGLVSQDVALFSGDIASNIRYPRPHSSNAEVEAAAAQGGLISTLRQLPQGFNTPISGGNGDLSAGQRQLVALARAHLQQANVLLLDEATARLDQRSEQLVMQSLLAAAHQQQKAIMIVAHRLSTAASCDLIAVMQLGRLAEYGSHAELLAANGIYARLWRSHEGIAATI